MQRCVSVIQDTGCRASWVLEFRISCTPDCVPETLTRASTSHAPRGQAMVQKTSGEKVHYRRSSRIDAIQHPRFFFSEIWPRVQSDAINSLRVWCRDSCGAKVKL